jgi:hypothetical protein
MTKKLLNAIVCFGYMKNGDMTMSYSNSKQGHSYLGKIG